jgi:hypothetical protein
MILYLLFVILVVTPILAAFGVMGGASPPAS